MAFSKLTFGRDDLHEGVGDLLMCPFCFVCLLVWRQGQGLILISRKFLAGSTVAAGLHFVCFGAHQAERISQLLGPFLSLGIANADADG